MTFAPSITQPGQLIHDAWRSVRIGDTRYRSDVRLRSNYDELADHQALCIVAEGRIERAIGRQLVSGNGFDANFVRSTMEEVYEGYNRFTLCMSGIGKLGLDWFADGSETGVMSISAVAPYNSLSHASKEIDRRMVVLILNNSQVEYLTDQQYKAIQSDSDAILDTVYNGAVYNYTSGYANEASFD